MKKEKIEVGDTAYFSTHGESVPTHYTGRACIEVKILNEDYYGYSVKLVETGDCPISMWPKHEIFKTHAAALSRFVLCSLEDIRYKEEELEGYVREAEELRKSIKEMRRKLTKVIEKG